MGLNKYKIINHITRNEMLKIEDVDKDRPMLCGNFIDNTKGRATWVGFCFFLHFYDLDKNMRVCKRCLKSFYLQGKNYYQGELKNRWTTKSLNRIAKLLGIGSTK